MGASGGCWFKELGNDRQTLMEKIGRGRGKADANTQELKWAPLGGSTSRMAEPDNSFCAGAQSCPTLCDSVDHSPPGSSVHGIFLARILEWVAISSSRGSSRPRD